MWSPSAFKRIVYKKEFFLYGACMNKISDSHLIMKTNISQKEVKKEIKKEICYWVCVCSPEKLFQHPHKTLTKPILTLTPGDFQGHK